MKRPWAEGTPQHQLDACAPRRIAAQRERRPEALGRFRLGSGRLGLPEFDENVRRRFGRGWLVECAAQVPHGRAERSAHLSAGDLCESGLPSVSLGAAHRVPRHAGDGRAGARRVLTGAAALGS
jgi:hypothetical protein